MRSFILTTILFSVPVFIVCLVGQLAQPEYGDLFRMARLRTGNLHPKDSITTGTQPEFKPLKPNSTNVLIIGDSFVSLSEKARNFHYYLPDSVNTIVFSSNFSSENNPFQVMKSVHDSLQNRHVQNIDFVVLETVERAFIDRLKNTNQTIDINWFDTRDSFEPKDRLSTYLGDGIKFIISWVYGGLNMTKTASSDVSRIRVDGSELMPVYARDLLFQPNLDTSGTSKDIERLLSEAESIFPNSQVRILICPDKSSAFRNHFEIGDSFRTPNWEKHNRNVIYPIDELKLAIEHQLIDVYRFGDTHFGVAGAEIVGTHLSELLLSY